MSTVDWLWLKSMYFISDPSSSQGIQVYGRENEVKESLLQLMFRIDSWSSIHISLAQGSHITKPDVKCVARFNPTMVWGSQYLGTII